MAEPSQPSSGQKKAKTRSKTMQRVIESLGAWAYIAPAGLLMLFITAFPQVYQAWMAFTNYRIKNLRFNVFNVDTWEKFAPTFVGLDNFIRVITSDLAIENYDFGRLLSFNIVWTISNVFFHVLLGIVIALALNRKKLIGRRIYRAIFVLPWAIPGLIIAFTWRNMFDRRYGAINQLIGKANEAFGWAINNDIRWLEDATPPGNGTPGLALGLIILVPILIAAALFIFREKLSSGVSAIILLPAVYFAIRIFSVPGISSGLKVLYALLILLASFGLWFALFKFGPIAIKVGLVIVFIWVMSGAINVLQTAPLSFWAVLIANIWLGWPFMTVIATGALQSIPDELYEAAKIDGASGWQQIWQITLPLIRPAMIPAIMVGTIWTFNNFNVIYFITLGGPFGRTELLVTQAFKLVFEQRLYGVAAAFSIVVFVVLLVYTLFQNRITGATEAYYE